MEVFPTKQVGESSINWSILDKKLTTVSQQGWNPHFSLRIILRLTRYKLSFPPHWHRPSWGSCGVWSPCNWRTHSSPSTPQSAYPKLWSLMTTVFQRRVNQYNPATSQAFRNSGQTKSNPGVQTPITTSLIHICTDQVCHVGWCGTQKKALWTVQSNQVGLITTPVICTYIQWGREKRGPGISRVGPGQGKRELLLTIHYVQSRSPSPHTPCSLSHSRSTVKGPGKTGLGPRKSIQGRRRQTSENTARNTGRSTRD